MNLDADGESIQKAIAELAHHDPAARFKARQFLVERGVGALPFIQELLEGVEVRSAPYYQELVRVRDWINYGADPEKLYDLMRALDPGRIPHGNMFGGVEAAIVKSPSFQAFIEMGERVLAFPETIMGDEKNPYSLRSAAAMLLRRMGTMASIPAIIAVLEREQSLIEAEAEGKKFGRLDEKYKGFFLASLSEALKHLTGESFPFGLMQTFDTVDVFYDLSISSIAIQHWRGWWEKMRPQIEAGTHLGETSAPEMPNVGALLEELTKSAEAKTSYARYALNRLGPPADAEIVSFALNNSQADDTTLSLIEMLIQNGRGASLPESRRTAELIASWLGQLEHPMLLRAAVNTSYAALPASTLYAISIAFPTHPLSAQYTQLFDPLSMTHLDTIGTRHEQISEKASEAVIFGLLSEDAAVRHLFFSIAHSAAALSTARAEQESSDTILKPDVFAERLLQITNRFTDYDERVAFMMVLQRLGRRPALTQVLEVLGQSPAEGELNSQRDLIESLSTFEIPEAERASVMEVLFSTAATNPPLFQSILSALAHVEPKHFSYNPIIGAQGLNALIKIYKLTSVSLAPAGEIQLAASLRELRADIEKNMRAGQMFDRVMGVDALDTCTSLARRFNIPDELYEALTLQATVLGQSEVIGYSDRKIFTAKLPESVFGRCEYPKHLDQKTEPISYDLAAALYEEASYVAADNELGHDKIMLARLSVADMARKAKRYEYAEKLYRELELREGDDLNYVGLQKHFLTELLIEQGRWADALDVALELRAVYSRHASITPEQEHLFVDTYLHEALCCHRLGEVNKTLSLCTPLIEKYEEMKNLQHYAEVYIEGASIYAKLGRHEEAEEYFRAIRDMLEGRQSQQATLADALRREATFRLHTGKAEAAMALLDGALSLYETLPMLQHRAYEKAADLYWLLGQAHLMQGDAQAADEVLTQFKGRKHSPLVRAYAARLQATIEASVGSIAAATITLQESLELLGGKMYPDLQVELCLDLAELLLLGGFHANAQDVLGRAYEVAAAARNLHMAARVRVVQARTYESAGDTARAAEVYRNLIVGYKETETLDIVNAAALSILLLVAADDGNINLADDVQGIGKSLRGIQDLKLRLDLLLRFAHLYLSRGRLENAEQILRIVEEEMRGGISVNVLLEFKILRGQAARLNAQPEEAIGHLREAVHIIEVVHASVLERGLGAGFFISRDLPYRVLVQSLVEAGQHAEALHYVERAKTRLFLDQVHWQVIKSHDETNHLGRYLQILRRLAFLELVQGRAAAPPNPEERQALEVELETLREEIPERELIAAVHPALGGPLETQRELAEAMLR